MGQVPPWLIKTSSDQQAIVEDCYFDEDKANKVKDFIETFCTLSDGERAGQPAKLLPWIWTDIVAPLYGWQRPDGTRRFRRGSCWCMKKQTKSSTLAFLALWHLLEEPGSEVYVISDSIQTASIIFKIAANAVEQNASLSKRLWVRRNINTIEDKKAKSFLKVLSGEKVGKAGPNATAVFWDELAMLQFRDAWDQLYHAGLSRKQPLQFSISTPQYNRLSLGFDEYKKAKQIIEGTTIDTEYLPVIYEVPHEHTHDPEQWWQFIPSLGITVTKDYYRREYDRVKDNPRELARFQTLLLGQWVDQIETWIGADKWEACLQPFTEDDLIGQSCYVGIDAAAFDLSAYVLIFPIDDKLYLLPRFFIPVETARKNDRDRQTSYLAFAQKDYVTLTDGDVFDPVAMRTSIIADNTKFVFQTVCFDPYNFEESRQELENQGIYNLVSVGQTMTQLAEPTSFLERSVHEQKIVHNGNSLLAHNVACCAEKQDAQGRVMIDRQKSTGRYDGVAATIIGLAGYLAEDSFQSDLPPVVVL